MAGINSSDLVGRSPGGRKLIAVVHADMVGYSRLIGLDDIGTLQRLRTLRSTLIDPAIHEHGGRIVQTGGDSLLIMFDSIDGAVCCAVDIQQQVPSHDRDQPPDRTIRFRVGITIGDVIADGTDLHGDGVNVAARLQAECPPGGICVSRAIRDHTHGRLGLTFDELGVLSLKNITRPVEAFVVRLEGQNAEPASLPRPSLTRPQTPAPAIPLPDKPSIAVLPFTNMSGDPEQEYFVEGMVEEIITALSRIHWLLVIARNSTLTYKGQAVDVKKVGRELGVGYVLEGSVRKGGNRVRITGQLIDAATGAHLWADRFDGLIDDVFELQDKVAASVAGVIEPALQAAEIRRAAARPTSDLTAYDLYLRALSSLRSLSRQGVVEASDLVEQAIERDPDYGPALSLAARCHLRAYLDGWAVDPELERRKGIDRARRALAIGRDDPVIITSVAFVLTEFGDDIRTTMTWIDRALEINPSYAHGWAMSGAIRLNAGQCDVAIEHIEHSLRLAPRDRSDTSFTFLGYAYLFTGRFDEAAAKLLRAIGENPGLPWPYWALASCYAHMGQLAEARRILERVRALTSVAAPSHLPWRNPDHRELFLSGLRLAADEPT
jgi:TolB-like protein/class 3 adenylate cyclase